MAQSQATDAGNNNNNNNNKSGTKKIVPENKMLGNGVGAMPTTEGHKDKV